VQIGISLTPIRPPTAACPAQAAAPVPGSCEVSGPFTATGVAPYVFGQPCGWLVYMLGIGPTDTVVWSMTWDDMEGSPTAAYFMLEDAAFADAPMAAQVVSTESFDVTNINVYATVNGEVYGPVVIECVA
jgi:hypothetical protein